MKKKIILACAALVVSAAAAMGYKVYQNSKTLTLLDANLEALTQDETVPGSSCYLESSYGTFEHNYYCEIGTIVGGDIRPCPTHTRPGHNTKLIWACHKL